MIQNKRKLKKTLWVFTLFYLIGLIIGLGLIFSMSNAPTTKNIIFILVLDFVIMGTITYLYIWKELPTIGI
ncbi:hypothetical protein J4403_02350 [Candidatus Woesearchaeota archaeon]|nr:hypothetical protein [Candidatus Woesearchaeota archaeon]